MSEQKFDNRLIKEAKVGAAPVEGNLALPRVELSKDGKEAQVLTTKKSTPLNATSFGKPAGVDRAVLLNEQKIDQKMSVVQERMAPGIVAKQTTQMPNSPSRAQSRVRSPLQMARISSNSAGLKRERNALAEKRSRSVEPISVLDRAARFIERMIKRLVRAVLDQLSPQPPLTTSVNPVPKVKADLATATASGSAELTPDLTLDLELSALRPRAVGDTTSQSTLAAPVINSDDGDSDDSEGGSDKNTQ